LMNRGGQQWTKQRSCFEEIYMNKYFLLLPMANELFKLKEHQC
jgi:hypothetical protein